MDDSKITTLTNPSLSIGVIASNVVTAILISCRAMGGLSADLYSFDWVITSYLLIKQFKMNKPQEQKEEADEEAYHVTETMKTDMTSFAMPEVKQSYGEETEGTNRRSTGVLSNVTTVGPSCIDCVGICQSCLSHLPKNVQ